MARSDIENMLEWKQRRGQISLTFTLLDDLQQLTLIWKNGTEETIQFADFIPMRIVTIIEVFVREAIRELVDSGSPYLEKAESLAKGARIDFALLSGLQGRKLSVGDLVAHTVSVNDPTRIVAHLSALIPDYVRNLRTSHERWIEEKSKWPLDPIIKNYDDLFAKLSRLFNVRHILTHEIPHSPVFELAEIDGFLEAASEFINATGWVLVQTLKDAVARTQTTMNMEAGNEMSALQDEMKSLILTIKSRGEVDFSAFDECQESWEIYATKEADLRAALVAGGSMYPMIWAGAKAEEIKRRVETLRWWAEREEGDI